MVRSWYLVTREGSALPREKRRAAAFLSVFGDRINGLIALVAVACLAALCCPTPLPPWLRWTVAGLGAATLIGVLAAPLASRLPPLPGKLRGAWECAAEFREHPRTMLAATLLSFVVQLANAVLLSLMGAALGLPVPPAYYGVLAPLVALVALLPISLNGMGLRELATVVLLQPMGVGAAEAVTLAVLSFAVSAAASLGGAGVLLVGRFPRPREVRGDDHAIGGDSDQGRVRQPPAAA